MVKKLMRLRARSISGAPRVVHDTEWDLDAHASTGVAPRGQKNLGAMLMRTPGRVAPSMEGLVKLMQEYRPGHGLLLSLHRYSSCMRGPTLPRSAPPTARAAWLCTIGTAHTIVAAWDGVRSRKARPRLVPASSPPPLPRSTGDPGTSGCGQCDDGERKIPQSIGFRGRPLDRSC